MLSRARDTTASPKTMWLMLILIGSIRTECTSLSKCAFVNYTRLPIRIKNIICPLHKRDFNIQYFRQRVCSIFFFRENWIIKSFTIDVFIAQDAYEIQFLCPDIFNFKLIFKKIAEVQILNIDNITVDNTLIFNFNQQCPGCKVCQLSDPGP